MDTVIIQKYLEELNSVESSYDFQLLLDDWKIKAEAGDETIWFLFKKIVSDLTLDSSLWNSKSNLSVGIFYILIDIGNDKAYDLAKWFIENCKEDTPTGAIELVSTLIPSFQKINIPAFFSYLKSENKAQSAIGFLTLFNLSMERKLALEFEKDLFQISKTYNNDYYYIGHIIDLIHFKFQKFETSNSESDKIDIQLVG